MFTKSDDLNFELFNPDPSERQSSLFTIFLFNAEELTRIRYYLLDYQSQYPFLEAVDKLLLATYKAKILIESGGVERGINEYTIAYNNFMELVKNEKEKEAKFMKLACEYCKESIDNSVNSANNPDPRSNT